MTRLRYTVPVLAAALLGSLAAPTATTAQATILACPPVENGVVHVDAGQSITFRTDGCNLPGTVVEGAYAKVVLPPNGEEVVAVRRRYLFG